MVVGVIRSYKQVIDFQGVLRSFKEFQGVSRSFKVFQRVSKRFKEFQGVSRFCIIVFKSFEELK